MILQEILCDLAESKLIKTKERTLMINQHGYWSYEPERTNESYMLEQILAEYLFWDVDNDAN